MVTDTRVHGTTLTDEGCTMNIGFPSVSGQADMSGLAPGPILHHTPQCLPTEASAAPLAVSSLSAFHSDTLAKPLVVSSSSISPAVVEMSAASQEAWGWEPELSQPCPMNKRVLGVTSERQQQNLMAVGGMRSPTRAIGKLQSKHYVMGAKIKAILARSLLQDP
eukprot:6489989-Amphidinium_carterae.1